MAGKGQKGAPFEGYPYGRHTSEVYDDDMVTIVVPRKLAEDFYYAISLAIGSRAGFATGLYAEWAPGKKGGMTFGMAPKGKGSPYDVPPK
jgi:hypothetical protein